MSRDTSDDCAVAGTSLTSATKLRLGPLVGDCDPVPPALFVGLKSKEASSELRTAGTAGPAGGDVVLGDISLKAASLATITPACTSALNVNQTRHATTAAPTARDSTIGVVLQLWFMNTDLNP